MITCIVTSYYEMIKNNSDSALDVVFHGDHLETIERKDDLTLLFINGAKKIDIWQAVLNLELEQITVGYGFGMKKEEAEKEALYRLRVVNKNKLKKLGQ